MYRSGFKNKSTILVTEGKHHEVAQKKYVKDNKSSENLLIYQVNLTYPISPDQLPSAPVVQTVRPISWQISHRVLLDWSKRPECIIWN